MRDRVRLMLGVAVAAAMAISRAEDQYAGRRRG